MKHPEAAETRSQPWRAIWPPKSGSDIQMERKANCGSGGDSGIYGYNDKGEGVSATPIKSDDESTKTDSTKTESTETESTETEST